VKNKSFSYRLINWLITAVLLLLALSTIFPLINTLAISLSDKAAVSGGLVNLWPVGFNLFAYNFIVQDEKFWRAFGVSLQRVFVGGLLNFVLAVLTAFPLSRTAKAWF
jgi:putative aldouronate transport system permease protein